MGSLIVVLILFVALVTLYGWYASIIKKRNKVLEALGDIDAQLKRRYNLIPNLLKMAQKFMDHEKELFTEITNMRESASSQPRPNGAREAKALFSNEQQLHEKMGQLFARFEAYPEMKSDGAMQKAMSSFHDVENDIAAARRFYNSAVGQLNSSIQIFPGSILAGFAKAEEMPFYEVENAAERSSVNADDFLK